MSAAALLDNLHVRPGFRENGLGRRPLGRAAVRAAARDPAGRATRTGLQTAAGGC